MLLIPLACGLFGISNDIAKPQSTIRHSAHPNQQRTETEIVLFFR
ncbi:Uncharacterised protein [Vibrio cholerae]|nr:Uncharacterised protein [Vibrio cholerae]